MILLLQFVLHNWSDDDCVRILKRAKEAISTREPKGKVVIIDTVVGLASSKENIRSSRFYGHLHDAADNGRSAGRGEVACMGYS